MKKAPLYSRSPRAQANEAAVPARASTPPTGPNRRDAGQAPPPGTAPNAGPSPAVVPGVAAATASAGGWRAWARRHERWFWATAMLGLLALVLSGGRLQTGPAALSPKQIDALVRQSLEEKPLPSTATAAVNAVRGSVVRVLGLMTEGDEGEDEAPGTGPTREAKKGERRLERGVGTGVVIIDNGTILTNLHVVQGAKRIKVTFADGHVSDARVISIQPENDLAVLRARSIPDDLEAATMRSTADLLPGDEVVAVGFPFGIGPSASAGIVSGLKREFVSPDGEQTLTNLIQFDAAANPGNSGGPLVTSDGAVVGIVTAILNPTQARTFIGIGFAVPIENAAAGAGMPPF